MARNALKIQTATKGLLKQLQALDEQKQYAVLKQIIEQCPEEFVAALAIVYDMKKEAETNAV